VRTECLRYSRCPRRASVAGVPIALSESPDGVASSAAVTARPAQDCVHGRCEFIVWRNGAGLAYCDDVAGLIMLDLVRRIGVRNRHIAQPASTAGLDAGRGFDRGVDLAIAHGLLVMTSRALESAISTDVTADTGNGALVRVPWALRRRRSVTPQ
jgi:hypothetical protein